MKVTHFQPQLRVHNLLAALPQWICFEASELREGSHLRWFLGMPYLDLRHDKNRVFKPVTKCIQVSSCLSLSLSLSVLLETCQIDRYIDDLRNVGELSRIYRKYLIQRHDMQLETTQISQMSNLAASAWPCWSVSSPRSSAAAPPPCVAVPAPGSCAPRRAAAPPPRPPGVGRQNARGHCGRAAWWPSRASCAWGGCRAPWSTWELLRYSSWGWGLVNFQFDQLGRKKT